MKKVVIIILLLIFSGCTSRNDSQNAYEEHRQERNEQIEISDAYQEKEDAYTSSFRELTFTGNANDFSNVILEINTDRVTLGMPRVYQFIEKEDDFKLHVYIIEESDIGPGAFEDIHETLTVDDIQYKDGVYTVYAEDYTFNFHTYEESIRRIKDDSGEMLIPSYYIPEELKEKWLKEAQEEVNNPN